MKNFWVSWYANLDFGFTLSSPWWVSGSRFTQHNGESRDQNIICAAIKAEDSEEAKLIIMRLHDAPILLEWRFVGEKPDGWSPFSDRFEQTQWMVWQTCKS